MTDLTGKVAIITGGGNGIGRAAVRLFAAAGASVVVGDIDADAAATSAADANRDGGVAVEAVCDIGDPAGAAALVDRALSAFGRLDVVYNNAGGPPSKDGDVTQLEDADWAAAFRVDLFGTIYVSRSAVPHMAANGGGSIVNTASCVAVRGIAGRDGYVAAKGAVMALTRSMAAEFGGYGITVNAIAPGITRSDRVVALLETDERTKALVSRHVVGLVEPADVAGTALFLAGDAARRITGQVISVDSGATEILTTVR